MISIIIPAYNIEDYLSRCLQSILNNSFNDYEIIIINDGSDDGTKDIINRYIQIDDRIRSFDIKHSGVSKAKNEALKHVKGEYVCFIDGDDEITDDYLYSLYDFITNNNLDWVSCNYKIIDGTDDSTYESVETFSDQTILENVDINKTLIPNIFDNKAGNNLCSNAMGIYKNEIIRNNNLSFNESISYGEDLLFNYEYCHHINRFGYLSDRKYLYRINNNNSSLKTINNSFIESLAKLIEQIENLSIKYNDTDIKEKYQYIGDHLWNYLKKKIFDKNYDIFNRNYDSYLTEIKNNRILTDSIDKFTSDKAKDLRQKIQFYLLKNNNKKLIYLILNILK